MDEYLQCLVRRGVSCNVASFIGATTPRVDVIGYDERTPTPSELRRMRNLERQAMEDGAVGVASALVNPPACFAKTDVLVDGVQVLKDGQHTGARPGRARAGLERRLEAKNQLNRED